MTRTVKVAVVGSGLAGLTAAYRLSKTPRVKGVEFEVHLFEKSNSLGLDSHSVSLDIPEYDGEYRVNVPMRSFQGGYYPQLIALYEHLGVKFREADFSYSFSTLFQPSHLMQQFSSGAQMRQITSTMIYNGKSGREGVGIPSSFFPPSDTTSQSLISFLGFVVSRIQAYTLFAVSTILLLGFYLALVFHSLPLHVNIPRTVTVRSVSGARIDLPFPKDIFSFIPRRPPRHTTLREWTEMTTPKGYLARRFGLDQRWREFVSGVMVLLFSAVCTASEEMVWDMPVEEILDYIYLTLGTHHYVVQNGVREVAKKLTEWIPSKQIHLSTPIVSLSLSPESQKSSRLRQARRTVDIHCAGNQVFEGFDHVILATQANQAGPLLSTYVDSLPISPSNPPPAQTDSDSSFTGDEAVETPDTGEDDDDDEEEKEALRIHSAYIQSQLSCLSQFNYCPTIVINHTDSTLLPSDSRDWRDLNLVVCPSPPSPSPDTPTSGKGTGKEGEEKRLVVPYSYTMATCLLPPPSGYSHPPIPGTLRSTYSPSHGQIQTKVKEKPKFFPRIYQTTNPIVAPRQETIMSVARLERPIVDVKSKRALRGLWKERFRDDSLVTINDEGEELDEEENTFGWRWGTSGSDGGVLGCLQGAGKALPLPPDSEDTEREKDGVERRVIQDVPGIWICGSYAHAGIPLLEGCVVSARNVVEQGIWVCEGVDEREMDKLW